MKSFKIFSRKTLSLLSIGILLIVASGGANIAILNFISKSIQSEGKYFLDGPFLFIGLLMTAFAVAVAAEWIFAAVGHNMVYQLRGHILKQILQTDPEHLQSLGKSKIYNAFSTDIPHILEAVMFAPYTLYGISLILGGVGYMFWLSWPLALLSVGLLIIIATSSNIFVSYCQNLLRRDRKLNNDLVDAYGNILDGHKELVLNEERGKVIVDDIMQGDALESRNILIKAGRLIAVNSQLIAILFLAIIGLVFWAIYHWQWGTLEIGVSFTLILMFIRQPIGNLVHQIPTLLHAKVSFDHLRSLNLPEPETLSAVEALNPQWESISIKNLSYSYPDTKNLAVDSIDLTINRGELIFLVGSNGAGKSTLVKMLTGLYYPSKGTISVDQNLIDKNNIRQYRAMFSAVLSDFHLFNHVLGNEADLYQDQHIAEHIKNLELQDTVTINNGRFNTTKLSTGQRKRLAMIVACLENRSIMVLDEWAADQDPIFRQRFYEVILPELKSQGLTLIVVSHDDRYFHVADRVILLENGKVIL